MKRNDNIDNDFIEDNIPYIKFTKKKTRYRTKLLKILIISSIIISIIFFLLIFNYKHKEVISKTIMKIENHDSDNSYTNAVDNVKNSLVTIGGSKETLSVNKYIDGNTTGIIIQSSGKILVNYSKIKDLNEIYVNLPFSNSKILNAEVIFINKNNDIAVLQVNSEEELTPIKIADRSKVAEGEKILLISNSTSDEYIDNLIPGVITSTNRQLEVKDEIYNLFEINVPINKFNTGGIISNLNGEVIGVVSEKLSDAMNVDGVYYALDLSSLEKVVDFTKEIKNMLGILKGDFIKESSGNHSGLYVAIVDKNSSSYKAGLKSTDIILKINDIRIDNITGLLKMLKSKQNGDAITCEVMRGKDIIEFQVILSYVKK